MSARPTPARSGAAAAGAAPAATPRTSESSTARRIMGWRLCPAAAPGAGHELELELDLWGLGEDRAHPRFVVEAAHQPAALAAHPEPIVRERPRRDLNAPIARGLELDIHSTVRRRHVPKGVRRPVQAQGERESVPGPDQAL